MSEVREARVRGEDVHPPHLHSCRHVEPRVDEVHARSQYGKRRSRNLQQHSTVGHVRAACRALVSMTAPPAQHNKAQHSILSQRTSQPFHQPALEPGPPLQPILQPASPTTSATANHTVAATAYPITSTTANHTVAVTANHITSTTANHSAAATANHITSTTAKLNAAAPPPCVPP